jgi:basic amino acid/polyamine antiporter, APA family
MSDSVAGTPQAGSAPAGATAQMFTRQTSGLVREFSLSDVTIMNLAGQSIGAGAALSVITAAAIWPGSDVRLLLVLGAILSLITAVVYGLMSAAMPRSGGDYVFVGRTLHPMIGFATNFVITVTLFIALGLYSYLFVVFGLSNSMTALGLVSGNHWIENAGATLSTNKGWIFAVALVTMLLTFGISAAGDKAVRWGFRILFAMGMIGVFVIIGTLLFTSREEFSNRLAGYLGNNMSLEAIRHSADAAGFKDVGYSISQTLKALPFGFWLFVGLTYTTYIGGEVKRPQRSQPYGMLLAILIGGGLELALIAVVYRMIGWDNIHAITFLQANAPDKLAFPTDPLVSFFASLASGNTFLSLVIGVSFVAWWAILLLFVVILPSRNLFAWSFDRLMPMALTKVSKNGTPYVANAIVGVLAVGVLILTVYTDVFTIVANYVVMISVTFLLAGVAAAVFPWRRPDLFERAPGIVRMRLFGAPVVAIGGVLQTILFAYIIWAAIDKPAFSGPTGSKALLFVVGVVLAGPVVYYVATWYRKRENMDIGLMYRELPPE